MVGRESNARLNKKLSGSRFSAGDGEEKFLQHVLHLVNFESFPFFLNDRR